MARHLPLSGALAYALVSAVFFVFEYQRLIAKHAWTAATVTIGLGLALTLVAGTVGWLLGRFLRDYFSSGEGKTRSGVMAAVLIALTVNSVFTVHKRRAQSLRFEKLLEEPLTPEQARHILSSGTDEERSAIAYNRSCPPEVLRALAASPSASIRANAAGNPSTPADVVEKLSTDPEESVRKYAGWNPARQAKKSLPDVHDVSSGREAE